MTSHETRALQALRSTVRAMFGPDVVAHDLAHLERVERNAARLLEVEPGDPFVVSAACLLHDLHRILERDRGHHVAPEQADAEVRRLLDALAVDPETIERVCACIVATERYRCAGDAIDGAAMSAEQRIVRDADMLDALGAVGIARAMMFGGHLGEPLWVDEAIGERFQHGRTASIVHHFHEKLLHLHEEMLTAEGRRIALQRTRLMRDYLEALRPGTRGRVVPARRRRTMRKGFACPTRRCAMPSTINWRPGTT